MRAEKEGEQEKVREEGVSGVEGRRQPALAAGVGKGRPGLRRGRDSPAVSRPGTLRGAHECTHTRARGLAPASCTGTSAHTPVPTCAHSHTCTNLDTR